MAEVLEQQSWSYELYTQSDRNHERGRHGVKISQSILNKFCEWMLHKGLRSGTVKQYRLCLGHFYADLPEDKTIYADTIANWREETLAKGYAPRTVNVTISAANKLLDYLGRRDLQTMERAEIKKPEAPELSRAEYLRLLGTAKAQGKEKAYLLTKIFASLELPVLELKLLTVEAMKQGYVELPGVGGNIQKLPVPAGLQRELLAYAKRRDIASGPIFLTKIGKPMWRTTVTAVIGSLCDDARVPVEKGNPRCLRQLYQTTMADIEENVARLVKQEYMRLLESEQAYIGWES